MKSYWFCVAFLMIGCKKKMTNSTSVDFSAMYTTYQGKLYKYDKPIQFIGANAFNSFGINIGTMQSWKIDIVREFIGNLKEQPIIGNAVQTNNSGWLHPLQNMVDSNRAYNRVTILCPFGWDGIAATAFTGKSPQQTYFYNDYKQKMQAIAIHFKNQPDVWIELWNEPYRYDRADGYTDDIWNNDMSDMLANIRSTGNNNMVVVPCAEQGQDESVLNNIGITFLENKRNIIFDIHAYEKWLLVSNENANARLTNLQQNKIPFIIGEVAPINAGVLMNPQQFLNNVNNAGLSVLAWVWKNDQLDKNALLTTSGEPNDFNNNNWGSLYRSISTSIRKP